MTTPISCIRLERQMSTISGRPGSRWYQLWCQAKAGEHRFAWPLFCTHRRHRCTCSGATKRGKIAGRGYFDAVSGGQVLVVWRNTWFPDWGTLTPHPLGPWSYNRHPFRCLCISVRRSSYIALRAVTAFVFSCKTFWEHNVCHFGTDSPQMHVYCTVTVHFLVDTVFVWSTTGWELGFWRTWRMGISKSWPCSIIRQARTSRKYTEYVCTMRPSPWSPRNGKCTHVPWNKYFCSYLCQICNMLYPWTQNILRSMCYTCDIVAAVLCWTWTIL